MHVTSARLAKIALQIPWTNFWSGHVVITVHQPEVHVASGPPPSKQSSDALAESILGSSGLSQSLTDVAGSLLHQDPEGRSLEQSLQDSLQLSDVPQPPSSQDQAGTIAASLVEALLLRLKIESRDAQVFLYKDDRQSHPDLRLTIGHVSVHTETHETPASPPETHTIRDKTRTILVQDVDLWSVRPASSSSSQHPSPSSSTSSLDDDPDNIMAMSQAVDNLAASALSGAGSMYHSAIAEDHQKPNHPAPLSPSPTTFRRLLSLGIDPLEMRLNTRKRVKSPTPQRASSSSDAPLGSLPDAPQPAEEHEPASASLQLTIGTIVCFLGDEDACSLWAFIQTTLETVPRHPISEQPSSKESQPPQKIDFSVNVPAIHFLTAYQPRTELTSDQKTALEDALTSLWTRPSRTNPPIGHLRLKLDALNLTGHVRGQQRVFALTTSHIALFEHLPPTTATPGYYAPIVVFDENLAAASSVTTSTNAPSSSSVSSRQLFDWRSSDARAASLNSAAWGPYQRTGILDKAWKLKSKHRRDPSSPSAAGSAEPSRSAIHVAFDSESIDVSTQPLHLFADLSAANRVAPFLHRLGSAHHSSARSHYSPDSMASSIDTLSANDDSFSFREEIDDQSLDLRVNLPFVRAELRVPSIPTQHQLQEGSPGLRSGLVALDLADLTLSKGHGGPTTSTPQPPSAPTMGRPRRTRFHADPSGPPAESEEDVQTHMSVRQASLLFQPVSAASATSVASLSSLSNDDEVSISDADEPTAPPLRPRLVFLRSGLLSLSSSTIARIPLVRLLLTKAVVDGLQLLADDAGIWARQVSRIGESSQDGQDGMRVLGSRFFGSGSRAGLSAISGSESAATIAGDKGGYEARKTARDALASSAVTVEVTEIVGDVMVPHQHSRQDSDASQDRLLTVKAQDLRTVFNPQHAKNTASVNLAVMTISALQSDQREGVPRPLLTATLPQSLSGGAAPMLSLQMLLYADPNSPHRESKIEPVVRGLTFTLSDDHQLLSDLAAFAKSPEGAFENVEPNEITRLNVKIASSSLHLAPSMIEDRAALSIGDLTIKSRLVGDSPQAVFTVGLLDSFLYVVDKPVPIPAERQRRIRTQNDYWTSQGYAKVADLKDVQGGLTTSRLTLPEVELRITRVRGHLEACADTLEALGRLIPAIMPKQEEQDRSTRPARSRSQTMDSEMSDSESLSTSSASGNLLSSVDEDAFRAAPTIDSIPDMLEDDIPSRPDFFGQPEMRGEQSQQQQYQEGRNTPQASDFETLPLSEEDFFGQESVASLVEPRQRQSRRSSPQRRNEQVLLQSDDVTIRLLDPRGVRPTVGYFSDPNLEPKKRSITGDFASAFRLRVEDCDLALKLYAGYDWKITRSEIEDEIKRIRKRLQKIKQLVAEGQEPDDSVEEAAQDLFESVHIALDTEADASAAMSALDDELGLQSETASSASTWQPLPRGQSGAASSHRTTHSVGAFATPRRRTKQERSTQSMIDLVFKGIKVEYDSLVSAAPLESSLGVTIRTVQILDNIKTSTWHAFLTEMKVKGAQRRDDASMVKVQLLTVRPQWHPRSRRSLAAQGASDRKELRVRAKVSPLRLHVDQDALDFFKKFFAFKRPSEAAKVGVRGDSPEPPAPNDPFIQYAEVLPIKLKLDYKPKRVDYGLLRKGRTIEMMNFFHFDSAEMTLRHLTLRGITGWPRLFDTLNDIWTPDVKANQLADVLSGIAPVRSIVNVGAGVADLILLPIEQYQKDGKIVKGVRKGASRFARVTALEALKLGARLATGTQAVLEKAESALVGSGGATTTTSATQNAPRPRPTRHASDELSESGLEGSDGTSATASTPYTLPLIDDEEHAALISKYADQPNGLSEALSQAYKGLRGGMNSAAQTILAVPMEVYEHGGSGASSGQRKVVKAVPVAVLQGARGASEAISKTLMGLRGALEPLGEDEMEKYKRHTPSGSGKRRS